MNDQAMAWWLDHTGQGRRLQRRILPESALMPRARQEAREEREEQERRADERRCLLERWHKGPHVWKTKKPIFDRMKDGEFSQEDYPDGVPVPGVSVPPNRARCIAQQRR